jgi:hypothetical protein
MSHQLIPTVDWDKVCHLVLPLPLEPSSNPNSLRVQFHIPQVQETFTRTTGLSGDPSEDSPSDNEERQQQQGTPTSTTSTPIPSPNSDTDVEMAQEDDDSPERARDSVSIASGIITDSVIGLDQLHPPEAQRVRQDIRRVPNLSVELPSLASPGLHNPPGASTGEGGIVIDTVADPRQRVSPIRIGGLTPSPRGIVSRVSSDRGLSFILHASWTWPSLV